MKTMPTHPRGSGRPFLVALLALCLATQVHSAFAAPSAPATTNAPAKLPEPETARDFFNAGTRLLKDGKFKEAERMLDSALVAQVESLQPATLYNLGHVRFQMGVEDLKKGPQPKQTAAAASSALQGATSASRTAAEALATTDMQRLVGAYMNGRGARRELNSAIKAIRKALETCGNVLAKWQRASSDFKSAFELNPKDQEARHNADVVDRSIAALIDSIREMESLSNAMGDKKQDLGEKMKQLKGRIPEEDMPPGAAGDEEEQEEPPPEGDKGKEEGPAKDGKEMTLSPEQAGWLLDSFKLDKDRKLPMGDGTNEAEPDKKNRPTW